MGGKDDTESVERFTKITQMYRNIMQADDDKFWLEAFDARVSSIALKREKRWARKRFLLREAQHYRQAKQARQVPGAAAAQAPGGAAQGAAGGEAAPAPEAQALQPGQLIVGAALAAASLVVLSFIAILASSVSG